MKPLTSIVAVSLIEVVLIDFAYWMHLGPLLIMAPIIGAGALGVILARRLGRIRGYVTAVAFSVMATYVAMIIALNEWGS